VADIAGAEKKLRQAEFFLAWLDEASKEYQGGNPRGGANDAERLEFYFSACLTAAQSAFYVLYKTGGAAFKKTQHDWRMNLKNDSERHRFNKMTRRRDDDVHYAKTGAKPLQKFIEEDPLRNRSPYSSHSAIFQSAALFGVVPAMEHENPDGTKVKGRTLRGAVGLYLHRDGGRVEATTACREFIDQLRSLLDATKAAPP
jgi:hypothetical protein